MQEKMKNNKYYTLESSDGYIYMAYLKLSDAKKDFRKYANSGICLQRDAKTKNKKIKFIW